MCPTSKFLESPAKSAFKRLILETPLYQHLLLTMSSAATSELNDADCEKGHVSQRPPISYATSKDEASIKASRETIKMKTPEGKVKVAVVGDSPGAEEYLQHISSFVRMLERKKVTDDLLRLAKAVASLKAPVRKLRAAPPGEKPAEKPVRLELLKDAVNKLVEAEIHEDAKLETVYELFRKTLKEDPELQWDRIVTDMHTKDPWEDLKGAKHDGIRGKSSKSLWECIDFHKRTIYSIDAAEQQRLYILCHLKKPAKSSIRAHVTRMEPLNKYLEQLPTIKNSPMAVASTKYGNVPFHESTLASIILSHLPVAWRNQYNLTHTIVPESPRANVSKCNLNSDPLSYIK